MPPGESPTPSPAKGPGHQLLDSLGLHVPAWVYLLIGALIALAAILKALGPIGSGLRSGGHALASFTIARRERLRAVNRRRLFADHIESQLRRLSEREDWRDSRFADLEAEVEIEGRQRGRLQRRVTRRGRDGLRRVKSLAKGLERSTERLILLQGEPGSGKSVALRHLAHKLAGRAMRSNRQNSRIPFYINLKELRPGRRPITGADIREFVLRTVNRANSRDIDEFLTDQFDEGMRKGTWLFLFDSFDEIPDILGSTETDDAVEEYADALYDFLHTMNTSRGIVSSREFRGPRKFGWPKFSIMRLSARQRRDLIRRAGLRREQEEQVLGGLATADPALTEFSANPMLLGLVCSFVRNHDGFPSTSHLVFEDFIEGRLKHDADRVSRRYSLQPSELRAIAEQVAFCMASVPGLGLSPSRPDLAVALQAVFGVEERVDKLLDALEFVKLGGAIESGPAQDPGFTFAHRRFQEYFATCVVLRDPERVAVGALLLDGKWRETAVTMLQTQRGPRVDALLAEAEHLLHEASRMVASAETSADEFTWPPGSLHVCELLVAGLDKPEVQLSAAAKESVGSLLKRAYAQGRRHDRKWAVSAVTLAPSEIRDSLLEQASSSSSLLLQEAAFAQVGSLYDLPNALARHLRRVLIGKSATGELYRDRAAIRAKLRRLRDPRPYLNAVNLLFATTAVDVGFVLTAFMIGVMVAGLTSRLVSVVVLLPVSGFAYLIALRWLKMDPSVGAGVDFRPSSVIGVPRLFAQRTGLDLMLLFYLRAVGLFLTVVMALPLPRGLNSPQGPSLPEGNAIVIWLLGFLVLLVATWPLAAISAVLRGGPAPIKYWPMLPMIEFIRSVPTVVRRCRYLLRKIRGKGWESLFVALAAVVICALFGLGVYGLFLWLNNLGPHAAIVVVAAMGVLVTLALCAGIWVRFVRPRLRRIADRTLFRQGDSLDEESIRATISLFKTDVGFRDLVIAIRRGDVVTSAGGIRLLGQTAARIEAAIHSANGRYSIRRVRRALGANSEIDHVSDRTLDEIARLVEERWVLGRSA